MRTHSRSLRVWSELDPMSQVVLEFEEAWRDGPPPIDRFRTRLDGGLSSYGLAELVKADLKHRYRRGERPTAREYLDRFPELGRDDGPALSLIYEEFCLRAETEEAVDPSEFCRAYPTWGDSLASQLAYHRVLSRAVDPEPSLPDFPEPGCRFGDYELVDVLGEGGAARVYLGRASLLGGKEFAVKVSLDRGGEPAILGRLDHPNIVPVLSSFVDEKTGLRGLCMPFRPGPTLDVVIRHFRREGIPRRAKALRDVISREPVLLDAEDSKRAGGAGFPESGSYAEGVAWVGLKIARALAHAHGRGFFHRDVKPDNVLLSLHAGPQLFDFNLAHDPELANQARAAHRGGTLPYMAREHLGAFLDPTLWRQVGAASDIFSLGLILRELLTVERPWKPPDLLDVPRAINAMLLHRMSSLEPIRRANPDVPHALEAIIAKCLEVAPEDRYPAASLLAEDLDNYLNHRKLAYVKNPSVVESAVNLAIRVRSAVSATAIAVVASACLIVGILSILANRPESTDQLLERVVAAEVKRDRAGADAYIQKAFKRADSTVAFEKAVQIHPGSLALRMGMATDYLGKRQLNDAEGAFREALKIGNDHPPALYGLACVEALRGNYGPAVDWNTRAIEVSLASADPSVRERLPEYRVARAQALMRQGDMLNKQARFLDASSHFERALPDLDHLDGTSNLNAVFSREFLSAAAEIGLAVSMKGLKLDDKATECFERARKHLESARFHGGDRYKSNVVELEKVLKEKVLEPATLPQSETPEADEL
jgi:serine/threonine protein kinase